MDAQGDNRIGRKVRHGLVAPHSTRVVGRRTVGRPRTPLGGIVARRTVPTRHSYGVAQRLGPVEFGPAKSRLPNRRGRSWPRRSGTPPFLGVECGLRPGLAEHELLRRSRSLRRDLLEHDRARATARPRGKSQYDGPDLLRGQRHPGHRDPTARSQPRGDDGAGDGSLRRLHQRQVGDGEDPSRGGHAAGLLEPRGYQPVPRGRREVESHPCRGHRESGPHDSHGRPSRFRPPVEDRRGRADRQPAHRVGGCRAERQSPRRALRRRCREPIARGVVPARGGRGRHGRHTRRRNPRSLGRQHHRAGAHLDDAARSDGCASDLVDFRRQPGAGRDLRPRFERRHLPPNLLWPDRETRLGDRARQGGQRRRHDLGAPR